MNLKTLTMGRLSIHRFPSKFLLVGTDPFDAEPAARDIVSEGDGGLGVGGDEDVAKENKRFFVYLCLWQFIEANP